MKKQAFTLAEVLITLVIIGVIAAMTIPTLLGNTNDQKYKTKFKKAVSMISQALQMEYVLYGNTLSTSYPSDEDNPAGVDPCSYIKVRMVQNHLSVVSGQGEKQFCVGDGICYDMDCGYFIIKVGDNDMQIRDSRHPVNVDMWYPQDKSYMVVPIDSYGSSLLYD